MPIFVYKGLTRNPEIENNPVWVLPNMCRLGRIRDIKLGTNVSNKMLMNAVKYLSGLLREKKLGREVGVLLPTPLPSFRLGLRNCNKT